MTSKVSAQALCIVMQVIQPQRWLDPLWRLTAALEAQLGCLVGINAYITPAGDSCAQLHTSMSHAI